MNVFTYDNGNNRIEINEPEILLIKEFKALSDRDKTKNKTRLWKELTYIYLAIDWKSLYNQYSEQERHTEALADSGITEAEFNDPLFREACRKYKALQESNKSIKMLKAAMTAADQFIDYFTDIVDLNERDVNGKPIFTAEKVMKEVGMLNKVHEELIALENRVKKELAEKSTVRAGAIEDFDPGDF
jgi:hypothetical protein